MKILVLNPLTSQTSNVVRDVVYGCWCSGKRIGGATVPPFLLVLLTTILRREGFDADFIDAQAERLPLPRLLPRLKAADVLVMSIATMSFQEDAEFLARVKEHTPGLQTIVFGSHPTFMPASTLGAPGIDLLIRHEPEHILPMLLTALAGRRPLDRIPGIGFRQNGTAFLTPRAEPLEDLDRLPFPDVSLLPPAIEYFNPIIKRLPYMTTTTSKGCPGKCIFCTAPGFDGNRVRFQSAEYVLAEIAYFVKQGIREIYFRDETFFLHKEREQKIFEGIIRQNIDVTWLANARVNLIDEETMILAKRAGCHTIKFGIESGNQSILDHLRKGYALDQAEQVFRRARRHGIHTHAHVMIGNPGETAQTFRETLAFVIGLRPTTATFGICTPYPGTPLFETVRARHPEIGDGAGANLQNLHIQGLFNEYFTSLKRHQLQAFVKRAYQKFYCRPTFWLDSLRSQIRTLDDVKRVSLAAANLFEFMFSGTDS